MSKIYTRVSRVADWAGWCSPCGSEDRPLVLTRSGPGGVHSWLNGLSDEDRILLLTCRVCGEWQFVPAREEDDPEILLEDEGVTPEVREVVSAIVAEARSAAAQAPAAIAPAPRQAAPTYEDRVYDARATAEPTVLLPAPTPLTAPLGVPDDGVAPSSPPVEVPVLEGYVRAEPVAEPVAEVVEVVEVVAEPVAELPAPRPAVERIVTVPDSDDVTLPAFSPEAVAAAAQVLSAARATLEVPPQRATDRARRSRGGPTPRRVQRPATARAHLAEVSAPPALPKVLGLPAGTRQLVLAAAS